MWIDNTIIVDMWQNMSATEVSGTVAFQTANAYFQILIEYRHKGGMVDAELMWLNAMAFDKVVVSSQYLFSGTILQGSPFVLVVETVLPNQQGSLDISAELSSFLKLGNETMIAGSSESIIITPLDIFGNTLSNICSEEPGIFCEGFPFIVYAVADNGVKQIIQTSAGFLSHSISETFFLTRSGSYNIFVELFSQNGLRVTSYDQCFTTVFDEDQILSSSNTTNGIFSPSAYFNASVASCMKFSGVFTPPQSGQIQFYLAGFSAAQFRVDNRLLAALLDGDEIVTDAIDMDANSAYSFSLEVLVAPEMNNSVLLWSISDQNNFQPLSNEFFFSGSISVPGSSVKVIVVPADICAGQSRISGVGATISFVSRASQFYILAKDAFSNRLSIGGQFFSFRLLRNRTSVLTRGMEDVSVRSDFNLNDFQNGNYSMNYLVNETAEAPFILDLSIPGIMGLEATYYVPITAAGMDSTNYVCFLSKIWNMIDFSTTGANMFPYSLPAGQPFLVRWTGLLKPQGAQVYTIYANLLGYDSGIRVWIDSSLVINHWQSFIGAGGSGTIGFDFTNEYYNIVVEYRQESTAGRIGVCLSWRSTSNITTPLPTFAFFLKSPLYGTPTSLHVHGLWTHTSVSSANVAGGTLISLNGYGFDNNQNYSMIFSGNDSASSLPVYPVSSTSLVAYNPTWTSDNDRLMSLSFSADGRDFIELYSDDESFLLTGKKCVRACGYYITHI